MGESSSPPRNTQLSHVSCTWSMEMFRIRPGFLSEPFRGVQLTKSGSPLPHQPGAPGENEAWDGTLTETEACSGVRIAWEEEA